MNIYLAGPMRAHPQFNFPAFFEAERILNKLDYTVFNPARRDEEMYGKEIACQSGDLKDAEKLGFSLREALAADTNYICKTANAVAMLPDWEVSNGARAEHALAVALGLQIIYFKHGRNGITL